MKKYRVPFSGRAHNYTDDEMDVIFEAIKKADPLTQGYFLNKFQNKFSEYLGTKNTFAVNNAAAALELAAQLCLFKSGSRSRLSSLPKRSCNSGASYVDSKS